MGLSLRIILNSEIWRKMGLSLRQLVHKQALSVVARRRTAIALAREGGAGGGLGMSSPPWEGPAPSDPRVRIGICYNSYIYLLPLEAHIS